ncbi:unnamed protein product [Ilex paraguariensis]|uniref:DUF4408 domain-containing protein n=1 Tax=Ilex paraguariensis TaxID=185542 RepID=A0ABC8UPS0_9AQUA
MAILSQNSSNVMLSVKILLISTSVLSMAVILKFSVPVLTEFAVSELPSTYNVFVSWLRPPYLYLIINCIIIIIVASSKLQLKIEESSSSMEAVVQVQTVPIKVSGDVLQTDYEVAYNDAVLKNEAVEVVRPEVFEFSSHDVNVAEGSEFDVYRNVDARVWETETNVSSVSAEMNGSDEGLISKSSWNAMNNDLTEFSLSVSSEKPLVSSRLGHRRSVKASPEGGKTLGVSKPRRQETLENTWKTITEGRSMPLTRHLRKSDTWETHGRHLHSGSVGHPSQEQKMIKSETFSATGNSYNSSLSQSPGSGKLRREPSPVQDELNRRVEAFIKKFNDEMRLQRQESLNQYREMINRGAT